MTAETIWGTVITVALGLLAGVLLWAVRLYGSRIGDERLRAAVVTFVEAAEQLYQDESGRAKLDWVFGELRKQFPGIDARLLRAMIEQAVLSVKWMSPPPSQPAAPTTVSAQNVYFVEDGTAPPSLQVETAPRGA